MDSASAASAASAAPSSKSTPTEGMTSLTFPIYNKLFIKFVDMLQSTCFFKLILFINSFPNIPISKTKNKLMCLKKF